MHRNISDSAGVECCCTVSKLDWSRS